MANVIAKGIVCLKDRTRKECEELAATMRKHGVAAMVTMASGAMLSAQAVAMKDMAQEFGGKLIADDGTYLNYTYDPTDGMLA